jgi:hypothetical protein
MSNNAAPATISIVKRSNDAKSLDKAGKIRVYKKWTLDRPFSYLLATI